MIYTLCWEEIDFMKDIKVNREQKILETVIILIDGGILPRGINDREIHIFSKRKGEYIDVNTSYVQADIFNGDILYIR